MSVLTIIKLKRELGNESLTFCALLVHERRPDNIRDGVPYF